MTEETTQLVPYDAESAQAEQTAQMQQPESPELPASEQAAPPRATVPKRESHAGTYAIAACIVALVAFTVLGSMLNVGDHLYAAHPALRQTTCTTMAVTVTATCAAKPERFRLTVMTTPAMPIATNVLSCGFRLTCTTMLPI
jgi:hypothetical protein